MKHLRRSLSAALLTASLLVAACSGGGEEPAALGGQGAAPPPSPPPPPPPPPTSGLSGDTALSSAEEAARFLMQASFGGDLETIEQLAGTNADAWLSREFAKPTILLLPQVQARVQTTADRFQDSHSDLYWDALLAGDDVLRQRMVFALSQIFVVSDRPFNTPALRMGYYQDVLYRNAFGNYRDLLEDITFSPVMAEYLTYIRNQKGDPVTGRMPDENFAREIMQLFSVGLIELNMDGTPRLEAGQEIETYDNTDITNLARVFTGMGLKGGDFFDEDDDNSTGGNYDRLVVYDDYHSTLEKSFLTVTIPENTRGDESIQRALDEIFAHPNVAPFVSKQLIQRFTDSDPDPDYVERVATAFQQGTFVSEKGDSFGVGERGDLQATLAAILLDPSIHGDLDDLDATDGKLREPILRFAHWFRAFNVSPVDSRIEFRLADTSKNAFGLAQHPFKSPSVFNFYRPGYVAPGTETGAQNMTVPEFQIVNEGSAIGYINFMTDFTFNQTGTTDGSALEDPDYTTEIALANDPEALVDHLNLLMTAGQMNNQEIEAIVDAIEAYPLGFDERAEQTRVEIAVTLITNSPSYAVIR